MSAGVLGVRAAGDLPVLLALAALGDAEVFDTPRPGSSSRAALGAVRAGLAFAF